MRGDARVQTTWIVVTSLLVLSLAVYGTVRLLTEDGAGVGQRARPRVPSRAGQKLPVQVIAQQWAFTYRYPTYGGVETTHLVLPVEPDDRTARHLARRDPLLLGLPARREGRRQPATSTTSCS